MISTLLPYYTISALSVSETQNFISADGKFLIPCLIVVIMTLWFKKYPVCFGFSIASFTLMCLEFYIDFQNMEDLYGASFGKHDIGAYLLLIRTRVALLFAAILFFKSRKQKAARYEKKSLGGFLFTMLVFYDVMIFICR